MIRRPTWAEVNVCAINNNMHVTRSLLKPETKLCAVVKADAYGHGVSAVAKEALACGADYLAVATLEEALELRSLNINSPVLLLGYTPVQSAAEVATYNLTQTVFMQEHLEALSAAAVALGRSVRVHLKVDTGMSRLGVQPEDAGLFARMVTLYPGLILEGVFTHFAKADASNKDHARAQLSVFMEALARIQAQGIHIPIRHCANSAAIIDMPEAHMDMVRAGIMLYGLCPSAHCGHTLPLQAAMKLKTQIIFIKDIPQGTSVSYGCTYTTQAPATIATLPIGYADGWSRMLSGKAKVLVGGHKVPVIGRICMDQCMLDITGIENVGLHDTVTLFGSPEVPADEIANLLGTINYEVVCMISKRVPRTYVREP